MTPQSLHLPSKFTDWRPHQLDLLREMLSSKLRTSLLAVPTGIGKSLLYMALASALNARTVVLVGTKALQDQVMGDFQSMGMVCLKGRANYPCLELEPGGAYYLPTRPKRLQHCGHGPCRTGYKCLRREDERDEKPEECHYFIKVGQASRASLLVTNYSAFMSHYRYANGLGAWDLMVCDEAHNLPDEICRFLSVTLPRRLAEQSADLPLDESDPGAWQAWAKQARPEAERRAAQASRDKEMNDWLALSQSCTKLAAIDDWGNWVIEPLPQSIRFRPVWPRGLAEPMLFRGTKRIILSSATASAKTAALVGLDECQELTAPHPAPLESRRLIHIPTARLNFRTERLHRDYWLSRIEQICRREVHLKGIIHTVSFDRAEPILLGSPFRQFMIHHNNLDVGTRCFNGAEAMAAYRAARPPAILVSPSAHTGYDFPDCISPTTRILRSDFSWVRAIDLRVGDRLAAFDENRLPGMATRNWTEASVLHASEDSMPCYRLTLEDGTTVVCSENHGWLCHGTGVKRWVLTKNLRADGTYPSKIVRLFDVWDQTVRSWETGYLAAAFDGEGHLYQNDPWTNKHNVRSVNLVFTQAGNEMFHQVRELMERRGYVVKIYEKGHKVGHWAPIYTMRISHRADVVRFLGEVRPVRLLPSFRWDRLGSLRLMHRNVKLVRKEFIGNHPVVRLATTTKTFIAEGLASHNSDCRWQIFTKFPWPDTRDAVTERRKNDDGDYLLHEALISLQQGCGRGCRHRGDWVRNYCVDDTCVVLKSERGMNLVSKWFRGSYVKQDLITA